MCKSVWKIAAKVVCTLILATFVYVATSQARVCFLPGGKCPGDASPSSVIRAVQGDQCLGYNLTQIKCKDQACEIGWDCESCTNAQGTFYKCTKKPTPEGYTPGLEKCPSPCQEYTWNGFTGNQINGKCESIPDYTSTKPNPCRTYITPDYICGASIDGAEVNDVSKETGGCTVCYTNVVEMSGYTTSKPASCTTYNSRRNGLGSDSDTMCYTSGTSIGENFSTTERDSEVFIIETKYGVDTFIALSGVQTKKNTEACYRATACNAANGWLKPSDIDANKFEYTERTSDGITCRKAVACKESNNWFNYDKLGQYKDKHFTTTEETRSGLTCYKAGGCHGRAYTSQPDARYFKFDKKTSNNYNCWTVTGKADQAYNAGDRKTNIFDYTSATAYIDGTTTQVTYYIVNKDNGRNGCMQYAYESQPDTRYFATGSVTHYLNGSTTTKTCWNITGKAEYAYNAGDRKTNFFDYTSATGYLNGTGTQVTYYIINKDNGRHGCMQYAYESQPDTRYFTTASETQYVNGSSTTKICWNATGKSPYAYNEGDRKLNFFDYTSATAYLNGTSTQGTYYIVNKSNGRNGCMQYAYENQPDAKYFSSVSATQYSDGSSTAKICWNATGKGTYAYTAEEKQTAYFKYDGGSSAYLNGTGTTGTYYNVTDCAAGASTTSQDTGIYVVDNKTQYQGGVATSLKCYHPLSCNVGYKQATAGNAYGFSCTACPVGTFNATPGSTTCTNCVAGTYNNLTTQTSASACKTCGAGTYSTAGSSGCTDCSAGTYAAAGSGSCTTCSAGTYSGAKAGSCTTCGAGTYSTAGSSGCTDCGSGTYAEAGSGSCTTCSAGTYSGAKAGSCTTCGAGTYSAAGSSGCTDCGSGTYAEAGSGSCTDCPAGTYSGAKAGSCTTCGAGTYSTAGSSGCTDCGAGTYAEAGSGSCTDCPAETYSGAKASTCKSCPDKPSVSQGCGCDGTQTRTATCNAATGAWSTEDWGTCDGQSDYYTGNYTSQGCGCSGTQYKYHYCLSGWGDWGSCDGQSDYYVTSESSDSGCSCGATQSRSYYCQSGWGDWSGCSGGSDYYVTSESSDSGCSCGATKSRKYYCQSGWGDWSGCSGGSDYEVDSESESCGCGGTKTRKKYCQTGWGDWSDCSKSDCGSGETCSDGTCVKTCNRPTSCAEPTCSDYGESDVTALGESYGYQVSSFTTSCYNDCGIAAVMPPTDCGSYGNIYLIRCCK